MAENANVNISRFDAIYGKELESNHPDILKYFVNDHKLNDGQIVCALSHIKIWEEAVKNNYENIIIFKVNCTGLEKLIEKIIYVTL
jgi:GR25 family glycosyltransferase involved in LPS biosynthesis